MSSTDRISYASAGAVRRRTDDDEIAERLDGRLERAERALEQVLDAGTDLASIISAWAEVKAARKALWG
ncbi:hypothetical protein RHODGE_RHODGE_00994 [Rhodoplanes serenus]|uniref:Uncharacterized protein n=1 Tax=Rhodoplanes serenus TaxID=200615 RepID=A0A3S4DC44_9BRAD|nr:hypothetical protein [Rhodoplanes serenus]MBI5111828.1 hypothetical protein [Rhodovulum sp.]VCU06617.1 hypothetical protein RHODPL_RHODPL_00065 [Rhodoplanes serenus]VCU07844.1 hypothetical protein RHODGE_RHODGE_00994 [Rhodoplanes serenus]